jgi:demethylspheroidene O-methyltransferase
MALGTAATEAPGAGESAAVMPRHAVPVIEPGQASWPSLHRLKMRLIASPAFQRWATRFPLTRPIARRNAAALFDIGAGFVYSQVLTACVRLHVFELLQPGPLATQEIAHSLGIRPDAAGRLLRAAAALDLLAPAGAGAFQLGTLGAALLGNPGVAAMIEHHALLYADLADPVALLRRTPGHADLAGYWPYAGGAHPDTLTPAQVASYSALMAASNGMVADQVLAAYRVGRHKMLLDVGGGEGTFLRAAARESSRLRLCLFDLPAVVERARARLAAADVLDRAELHGGDFFHDKLPHGADLISLVRVVHDHDDDAAMTLLRNVRRALPEGGTLLLAEPMAGRHGAPRVADAYFGFYLLAMGSGRARTPELLCDMLLQAGFRKPRQRRTGAAMLTGLIVAGG